MRQSKQKSKVVPFTGEFYQELEPAPPTAPANLTGAYLVMVAAALIGGMSIGAIATYQNTDQVQLRQLKADATELQQLKNQVCKE